MTGYTLKLIGIMLMLMDHIHYMFPQLPLLMTQLGRLCAPIFIFMTANGKSHWQKLFVFTDVFSSPIALCSYDRRFK